MPYEVDNQPSAGGELALAAGSALGAAFFVPGAEKIGMAVAKGIWKGAIKPAAQIAGIGLGAAAAVPLGAGYVAATTSGGRAAAGYAAKLAIRTPLRMARTAIGGTAYAAYNIGKVAMNHPILTTGLAGAAGVGMATMGNVPANSQMFSGGMVDVMGGTSNYGVSGMMSNMNASGNIVLGANRRRR